jgi:hypothetical protein
MFFAAFMVLITGIASAATDSGGTLYIYYPSMTTPSVLQQKITDSFPGAGVMVFGRYQDFIKRTGTDRPAIIITKPQVLQDLPGYSARMSGIRKGSGEEPCVLLSIDNAINLDSISGMTIGAVDFLGRVGTEEFVSGLLHKPVHVCRVVKTEDLLPLLTFNKARAILTGEGTVADFKKMSQLRLVTTRIPGCSIGIAVCATRSQETPGSREAELRAIAKKTIKPLEIDQWKPAQ